MDSIRVVKENCHKDCRLMVLHSTCFLASRHRTPIMAQMLHKLESMPEKKQTARTLSQYAALEKMMK